MVENGEQSITHCKNCGTQFLDIQKIADWIYCDECDITWRFSVKKSIGNKEE